MDESLSQTRSPPPVTSPDDQRLVENTNLLAQQAGISKVEVREVHWRPWVLIGRRVRPIPSDWVFFQRQHMIMPAQLVGKLSVDEWRSLIASSLFYEKKVKRSIWPRTAFITLLPLILLALVFAATVLVQSPVVALLYFVLIFPVTILGNRWYNPQLKTARLRADQEAAQVVGRGQLLGVLRKIDGMSLLDVEALKSGRRVRGLVGFPTITQRIENIQSYPSNPS